MSRPVGTYFEDYAPGQAWRHARGTSVGETENQLLSKLVLNTAQEHWNDDAMRGSPWGDSRIVFGLVTVSIMIGLASQDASDQSVREVSLTDCRLRSPVFHGDTLYACTQVLAVREPDHPASAGLVTFKHWALNADGEVVAEATRAVLVRRRTNREETAT